ncbi:MAG: YncE family protein [Filimonas sp.]|nr:YncE family protein [Filimonas sp.]
MSSHMCRFLLFLLFTSSMVACRKDPAVSPSDEEYVDKPDTLPSSYAGFYVLNEGNMGSNKASIDFYNYNTGVYKRNIYSEANPDVVKELGDVGNDIQVYGSKAYAVINMSNKVEVFDAYTIKRIGQIEVPNCRYVTFYKGKAYVSSYAGYVGDPASPLGYVAEIDTASLKITRTATVGYQPEEMEIVKGKLYVANSGGYRYPNYDRTVSVIDLATFKETKKIDVAINLDRIKKDAYGDLYVTSRGDYFDIGSKLFIIDTKTDKVKDSLPIAASNLAIQGDSAYIYSVEWNNTAGGNTISYAIVNVKTESIVTRNFITDGTDKQIQIPYGLLINPLTHDIYIADAKDYVTPGTLYCFDKTGKLKWRVTTGDIPGHFALLRN